jgi:hypothetical protein
MEMPFLKRTRLLPKVFMGLWACWMVRNGLVAGQQSRFIQRQFPEPSLSSIDAFILPEEQSIAFYSVRQYNIFITPEYQLESREWAVPDSPSS